MKNCNSVIRLAASSTVSASTAFRGLLISFLFCLGASFSFAAPGDLDATFGSNGKVITPVGSSRDLAEAVALQTDGKIVVAGYAQSDFAVVRYNRDGSLDSSFGTNGKVITPVGAGTDEAYAVAIQMDGKIIVAGQASGDFAVVRLNTNGTLDAGFGTNGKVITNISGVDIAEAVIIQPDGKIIAAGWSGSPTKYALIRYNADGALDSSFGTAGKVTVSVGADTNGGLAHAAALQSDGKILVAGEVRVDLDRSVPSRFSLVRLNTDGSLDSSFGTGGKVITAVTTTGSCKIYDIAIQTDGRIVAAGVNDNGDGTADTALVRYTTSGAVDSTFGTNGAATVRLGAGSASTGEAVKIQANGKIVVAGNIFTGQAGNDFAVARFNAGGTIDASFGASGTVVTPVGSRDDQVRDAAIQSDGRIVLAGFSENAATSFIEDFALVRYLGDSAAARKTLFDFDGDGRADYSVVRSGNWYIQPSGNPNTFYGVQWGFGTDKLAPADYDGDGRTDIAVWREDSFAYFYIFQSQTNTFRSEQFGQMGDNPVVVGDFDGDGKADPAVYRVASSSNGQSYFFYRASLNNPSGGVSALPWGTAGDLPVRGDFDGDGRADAAVFRPSDQAWYIRRSSDSAFQAMSWGFASDKRIAGDFDGDGRTDFCVFRPSDGVWYILQSSNNQSRYQQWGFGTDIPVAADYDGDGKTDIAVWRPGDGVFYILQSGNQLSAAQFGQSGDIPIAASFIR